MCMHEPQQARKCTRTCTHYTHARTTQIDMHTRTHMHESQHLCKCTRTHYTHAHMHTFTHVHTQMGTLMGWGKKRGLVTVTMCACVLVWVSTSLGKLSSMTFCFGQNKWVTRSELFKSYKMSPLLIHSNRVELSPYGLYVSIQFTRTAYI